MMVDIVAIVTTTIILGSIYGLVAIGMSLIYGILRVLDMSQGSMVMVGSGACADDEIMRYADAPDQRPDRLSRRPSVTPTRVHLPGSSPPPSPRS